MDDNFYCPSGFYVYTTCKLKSSAFRPTVNEEASKVLPWCPYYTFSLIEELCEEQ
jgi:hypothetical protein